MNKISITLTKEEWDDKRFVSPLIYSSYEEAELACLDKLIEIVELKQNKDE